MHPSVYVLLLCALPTLGFTDGFNPALFHRTAFDKRGDVGQGDEEDMLQDSYLVQMPECLSNGGVCTSVGNCPPDHLLNLQALESAPCGDQSDVVCCKPTGVNQKEVLQMDACNQKGAFCTHSSSCPSEFRMDNPLLCGDQSEVSCCRTGLTQKKSMDFKSESKNELHVQNQKRLQNAGSANGPIERRDVMKRKDISKIRRSPPFKLTTLGVAKRQEASCKEVHGVCVEMEDCPEGDIVADQKFCSGDEAIVCCRSSLAIAGVNSYKSVSFPDGGTDPEDMNPI